MNINRRSLIGGALALSILGGGVATSVASMSGASASSVYTTSKLAQAYTTDLSVQIKDFKMLNASVLTNGNNSTLVMTFNKNVTKDSLNAEMKKNKGYDMKFYVGDKNMYTVENSNVMNYDVAKGTASILNLNEKTNQYDEKTVKTNIRFSGNTVSVDFPKNYLPITQNGEIAAGYNYKVDTGKWAPHTQDYYYRSTDVKTNNFGESFAYLPHE